MAHPSANSVGGMPGGEYKAQSYALPQGAFISRNIVLIGRSVLWLVGIYAASHLQQERSDPAGRFLRDIGAVGL